MRQQNGIWRLRPSKKEGDLMDNGQHKVQEDQPEFLDVKDILSDVGIMAQYALESGQLPDSVSISKIKDIEVRARTKPESVKPEDVEALAEYHKDIGQKIAPVTPQTLRWTRSMKLRDSRTGRYLFSLYALTFLLIVLIFILNYLQTSTKVSIAVAILPNAPLFFQDLTKISVAEYLIPFMYGALGSCAYLLRVTELKLRERSFDYSRIPEHINRLVLGTLSGGVIVLFLKEFPDGGNGGYTLTQGALGFIAGYSVDLLFDVIDRIINAILPHAGTVVIERKETEKKKKQLLRRVEDMKKSTDMGNLKKSLDGLFDELKQGRY
jgi:hypothetical protein